MLVLMLSTEWPAQDTRSEDRQGPVSSTAPGGFWPVFGGRSNDGPSGLSSAPYSIAERTWLISEGHVGRTP